MSTDPKAGTTTQDDGDAQATGTPGVAGGNAGEQDDAAELEALRAFKAQALAEKTTLEQAKRELEELKARSQAPPTNGAGDPGGTQRARINALIAKAREYAARGDEVAELQLVQLEGMRDAFDEIQRTKQTVRDENYLAGLPADLRDEVRKEYETGNYRTPEHARRAVLGLASEKERAALAQQQKELERERQVRETGERAASPQPVMGDGSKVATIKESEYNRRMENDDIELYRAVENGRIKVLYGK
jgi:hypothetical protein